MRLMLFAMLTAPALAGIDTTNASVSLHESATHPLAVRFRIHCQPVTSPSPCGSALVDVESGDVSHGDFLALRAAAAESACTVSGVTDSEFDVAAGSALGTFWAHTQMTTARKAMLCEIVDSWW